MTDRRLIVIGAGPIGLAAALGGVRRGWDVTVLEVDEVGESLRRWGPTRFFSPFAMNLPPGASGLLAGALPSDDAILTGPEFVDTVLVPLATSDLLAGRINTRHRVIAVGRSGLTRSDLAGHPIRGERPFRLLVETPNGERIFEAERVMDASGTYGQPAAIGIGGIPAPGERSLKGKLIRSLGAFHARLEGLHGKRILLIGHGHSAANAIVGLAGVGEVVWATRSLNQRPCVEVPSDPLPERRQVVAAANQLATHPPPWLKIQRRAAVEELSMGDNGSLRVALGAGRVVSVDEIVALTGYRPDLTFLSELALEIAPSTEGSSRLTQALSNVTDCLSLPSVASSDLDSGEFGFHLAGAKSYGRARTFLLKNGYAQLETILNGLESVG